MKKLIALFALLPATVFAHGAHQHATGLSHDLIHMIPGLFLAALVVVLLLMWRSRRED